ncbi:hypothetical protein I5G21_31615 [Pseudomonas aeruginosa]|nr:hypothetical protein [Pseudomonas aeruginosa]
MNQVMPWDGKIMQIGWPWHGKIYQLPNTEQGAVHLPNGETKPARAWSINYTLNHTHLVDMGLPSQPDEFIESQGGSWWGRAILRGGGYWPQLYYGGGISAGSGAEYSEVPFIGTPIWWLSDELPRRPSYAIYDLREEAGTPQFRLWIGNNLNTMATLDLGADLIGQGEDQPACAVRAKDVSFDGWQLTNKVVLSELSMLGVYQNRLLFGVYVRTTDLSPIEQPPGTSWISGSSNSGAPAGFYGLIEITVSPSIRDPDADRSKVLTITVLETRAQAMGNPTHMHVDESSPIDAPVVTANYRDEWVQTSALITAWYDAQGNVRSARYNRQHYGARTYRYEQDVEHSRMERASVLELITDSGQVADHIELKEILEAQAAPDTGFSVTRTIQCTGESDDVTSFLQSDRYRGVKLDTPATFPPGLHVCNTVVSYEWLDDSGENLLDYQDHHQVWIVALSNNSAALCRVREPYDYPEGQSTTTVTVRQGAAVRIGGITSGAITDTITKEKEAHRYLRGFFWSPADRWTRGSCNPITGELSRGAECLQYWTSWV